MIIAQFSLHHLTVFFDPFTPLKSTVLPTSNFEREKAQLRATQSWFLDFLILTRQSADGMPTVVRPFPDWTSLECASGNSVSQLPGCKAVVRRPEQSYLQYISWDPYQARCDQHIRNDVDLRPSDFEHHPSIHCSIHPSIHAIIHWWPSASVLKLPKPRLHVRLQCDFPAAKLRTMLLTPPRMEFFLFINFIFIYFSFFFFAKHCTDWKEKHHILGEGTHQTFADFAG